MGDVVRKKNIDGSFNKNAEWYVKTPFGWRKANAPNKRKPTAADIRRVMGKSRKGRS